MKRNPFSKALCTSAEYLFSRALFVIGLMVLAVTVMGMMLTSCSKKPDRKKDCELMAIESLRLQLDNPESMQILAISDLDSIFGRHFLSDDDLAGIVDNITSFNETAWNIDNLDFENPTVNAKMERAMAASELLRNLLSADSDVREWSGWKMRVKYSARDYTGSDYESERYVIFDKDLKYIIHSFEIPIL